MKIFRSVLLLIALSALALPAPRMSDLQDCLDHADADFAEALNECHWNTDPVLAYRCMQAASDQNIADAIACHLKYDTTEAARK